MQDIPARTPDEYRKSKQAHLDAMIARVPSPAQANRELSRLNRPLSEREVAVNHRRGKPVVLLGADGRELGRWVSGVAASHATGIGYSTIKESMWERRPIRDGRRFVFTAAHLAPSPDARAAQRLNP